MRSGFNRPSAVGPSAEKADRIPDGIHRPHRQHRITIGGRLKGLEAGSAITDRGHDQDSPPGRLIRCPGRGSHIPIQVILGIPPSLEIPEPNPGKHDSGTLGLQPFEARHPTILICTHGIGTIVDSSQQNPGSRRGPRKCSRANPH